MSKSAHIRLADAHFLLHVVGECRELGDDPRMWWRHAIQRLCAFIGGEFAVSGELTIQPGGEVLSRGASLWGFENGFDQVIWTTAIMQNSNLSFSPVFEAYFARCHDELAKGVGLTRTDIVADRLWERSNYYRQLHQPLGLQHTLICFAPLPARPDDFAGITLSREAGNRRDFSDRDCMLVRELNGALTPLIGGSLARFNEPSPSDLPRRVRQVLDCLLEGDGDKQIAARLGISRFTVNQYTKTIFQHFGVRSRAELMARWVRRARGQAGFAPDS